MRPRFSDWQKVVEENKKEKISQMKPALYQIAQAAPKMELLTGDEKWDAYLKHVQSLVEQTQNVLSALKEKYFSDLSINDEERRKLFVQTVLLQERVNTMNLLMGIPKQIMESGKAALDELSKIETKI